MFYDYPDLRSAQARVLGVRSEDDGRQSVTLDRSVFYPEGGGQPCDSGSIAGFPVRAAVESGDAISVVLEASPEDLASAGIAPGATVLCEVDLERRLDHSEQHTAQHLLSAVLQRVLKAATLSFRLGERLSSIDIDASAPARTDLDAIEDEVMRVIRDDYAVITHLCPPEDSAGFPLRKEPSVDAGVLRVVEIDGLEYSACCGTHVAGTGALGLFRITKAERYKGGSRLYFVAGGRALADYRRLAGLARDAAAAAGTTEDEAPQAMAGYKDRLKALEKALDEAKDAAAASEAARLVADSIASAPGTAARSDTGALEREAGGLIVATAPTFDAASRLAKAIARAGRPSLVSSAPELKVAAASPASTEPGALAVDAAFGELARAKGGKGGGGKTFFQSAFQDAEALGAFIEEAARSTMPAAIRD
jgi:alanyl-tRNA synthetase